MHYWRVKFTLWGSIPVEVYAENGASPNPITKAEDLRPIERSICSLGSSHLVSCVLRARNNLGLTVSSHLHCLRQLIFPFDCHK